MKRCPFRAEEIQDEAVVCRWCGRDLDANAYRFPTPRGVAFGAKGERYLFGVIVDRRGDVRHFGIWDADHPGPPIERFELLPKGRDTAATRFRELEAGNTIVENRDPPACPRCGWLMRWFDGGDRAANTLTGWAIFGIHGALVANQGDKRFVCPNCGTMV